METIEATFRVVTPMFMSGADQSKAELRLPSIKGALRFWWRALAWGRLNGDLATIRKEENELFGSTDTGQAGVLMKLKHIDDIKRFLETQNSTAWRINDWQSYVGYGLVDRTTRPSREYIKPGLRFCLQLSSQKKENLISMSTALKAFGLLGGLGGRSRKGWGSVSLQSLEGSLSWVAPTTIKAYQNELDTLLSNYEKTPSYTAFTNKTQIEFGETQRSSETAHKYLANIYKESIRDGYNKGEREQFGLPRSSNNNRRASQVFLHVHELSSTQVIPVAAFLPAQFLEDQATPKGNDNKVQVFLDAVIHGGLE